MNHHLLRRLSLATALALGTISTVIACSNGSDSDGVDDVSPDAAADARDGSSTLEGDGSTDGGAADAQIDDGGDAAARTCTDDFVCHTELPPKSNLRDVWSAGDGIVWTVAWDDLQLTAAKGTILRWDGKAWSPAFTDKLRLHAIWGSSSTDIWAGGDGGLFHGTGPSSDALTWTKVRSEPVLSIWGSGKNDVWAVGATYTYQLSFDGKVLHYQGPAADGGDGWELETVATGVGFRKVWGTSANDVWIGGEADRGCPIFCIHEAVAYHRVAADGGYVWTLASPAFGYNGIKSSDFSGGGSLGPNNVWLMGSTVSDPYSTQDGRFVGAAKNDGSGDFAWKPENFGTCAGPWPCKGLWYSRAVWGTKPDDVFLAGDFGQVRHWDGSKFSFVKTTLDLIPTTSNLYAMWGSSNTDLWIVGDQIALHKVSPTTH